LLPCHYRIFLGSKHPTNTDFTLITLSAR
jgi:hypothetical protein